MTNPSEILVAAGGTVTIDTEEYRLLVENTAYLNMILAFTHDPKNYILSDVCCMVEDLMNKRVQVIKADESTVENTDAMEALRELHDVFSHGDTSTKEGRPEEAVHAE